MTLFSLNSFSPHIIATSNSRLFAKVNCLPKFFFVSKKISALILLFLKLDLKFHNNFLDIFHPSHKLKLVFDYLFLFDLIALMQITIDQLQN